MKSLAPLVGLLVIGMLLWSGYSQSQGWKADTARVFQGVDSARHLRALHERDSLQSFIAEHLGMAERETGVANRLSGVSKAYRKVSDSLGRVLDSLTNTSDSLQVTLGRVETLEVALDTAEVAIDRLRGANAFLDHAVQALVHDTLRLHVSDSAGWASVDSLSALVRRAPTPKWFQPVLAVGYGAVLNGGVVRAGPSLSVGFRLPLGRQ